MIVLFNQIICSLFLAIQSVDKFSNQRKWRIHTAPRHKLDVFVEYQNCCPLFLFGGRGDKKMEIDVIAGYKIALDAKIPII